MSGPDYAYAPENIPTIKVMGENAFWDPALEETIDETEAALREGDEGKDTEGADEHEVNTSRLDESYEVAPEVCSFFSYLLKSTYPRLTSQDRDVASRSDSPVDLVHQLGVYIHSSPQRMEEFEKIRCKKNPDTPKGLLPLKDVVTRWNSKEAAIKRVLRLRETVEAYTRVSTGKKCPRFTKEVFEALSVIQPALKVFLHLTQVYSEVGAHSYRIIPDLINAIEELRELHAHPSVSTVRREASEAAIKKLQKYLNKFLMNKWVCAAFAFDPTVRQEGLEKLLTKAYAGGKYYEATIDWIKTKTKDYQEFLKDRNIDVDDVQWVKKPKRVNKFASSRFQAGHQEITHDMKDPWACYNSELKRFETTEDEPVLAYWKRMAEHREMLPLALFVRDVLGLASSSASVERLFSQAGHVLGKRRGSLSASLLTKQTMLRMWEMQGFMTSDDMVV